MTPDMPNTFYRVAVGAVILDETRTKFLIALKDSNEWELPGGGIDWGEDARISLAREIQEEMEIEAEWIAERPCYFFTHQNLKGLWKAAVLYEVKLPHLDFTPTSECREIRFIDTASTNTELLFEPRAAYLLQSFDPARH